jgi:outer membrane cobalamin receptor
MMEIERIECSRGARSAIYAACQARGAPVKPLVVKIRLTV